MGLGVIRSIDYTLGEVHVDTGDPARPARVRINDPNGRFGRLSPASSDGRFSVDDVNPTIHAATGYPMCIPRVDLDPTNPARDHSPTETNLTLSVTDGAGPAAVTGGLTATIRAGRHPVRLAPARRTGLRVRFTAPTAARTAVVRAYRLGGGVRRLIGRRTRAVRAGANLIARDSPAIRRAITPGVDALEVVLRGTGGTQGRPATTTVRVTR